MHPRREAPLQDIESSQGQSTGLARRVILERPDLPFKLVLARFGGPGAWNLIPQSGPPTMAISPHPLSDPVDGKMG
jgi:hypothetical protein